MDGLEIHRGVSVSIIITYLQHGGLPSDHRSRLYIAHALLSEVRKDFSLDQTLLRLPGIQLDALFHILLVQLAESLKFESFERL